MSINKLLDDEKSKGVSTSDYHNRPLSCSLNMSIYLMCTLAKFDNFYSTKLPSFRDNGGVLELMMDKMHLIPVNQCLYLISSEPLSCVLLATREDDGFSHWFLFAERERLRALLLKTLHNFGLTKILKIVGFVL